MNDIDDGKYQSDENLQPVANDDFGRDATPLCPACLKPVNPLDYYCPHCGSSEAINPLTPYMPYVRIRYMCSIFGAMWRKVCERQTSIVAGIFYVLLIVVLAPVIIIAGVPVVIYRLSKKGATAN